MRRGYNNGIMYNQHGALIGINLGSDFTSEHEWGIKGIKQAFGIEGKGYGLEKRTMTRFPENLIQLHEDKLRTVVVLGRYEKSDKPMTKEELSRYELSTHDGKMGSAWDESSFGISALVERERKAIREMYKAMQNGDVAIWLGGGGVFQNAGLVLCRVSRVPEDKAVELKEADIDAEKLAKAGEATGIYERLEKAGKGYYACSPWWAKGRKMATKHEVVYWLNPSDQQNNNYGCFTVEELDAWIAGQGPVPKTMEQKRKRY